ncbi:MAG: hypothetical protein M0017_00940 [Desulfobacteraceae bacterium]|nr:hypothetical protein [Desulfobacteraceae bacterium]
MKFPSSATLRKIKRSAALTVLAAFLAASPCLALDAAGSHPLLIPSEYGKVIYRKRGNPDEHLYIICQCHRNPETGANGPNTVAVQTEIYRIGEWLVRNEKVNLLLPEGYFGRSGGQRQGVQPAAFTPEEGFTPHSLDDATLHAVLNDTKVFTNADKLLKESYHLKLQQVEDEKLYFSVLDVLLRSGKAGGPDPADLRLLDYLQQKRSAALLQAIPDAIGREVAEGGTTGKKAIFTIGMAHVNEMIRFLKQGKITIDSPLSQKEKGLDDLKLAKENYTVTVILPRSLAEDPEAMRLAHLADLQ